MLCSHVYIFFLVLIKIVKEEKGDKYTIRLSANFDSILQSSRDQ